MILHWLHTEPETESLEVWATQVAQAVWIEKRHWETLSKMLSGKK